VPDGSFALVRSNPDRVELCSDFVGSRTLWYALTDRHFFASTSQRAIIALLGSLDYNASALVWFLSSGSLGPTESWDRRISRLPGGARLGLDRASWSVRVHATPAEFRPEPMDARDCREELARIAREAIQTFDFSTSRWLLPLSGGYDCRFILMALVDAGLRPRTATWGMAASIHQPGNDAFVARQLAAWFDLPHEYHHTDIANESPEAVVDRFLAASGGTTDQLFPYLDGLRLWSSFADQGVDGIIRGDEGFGWIPLQSDQHARTSVGLTLLTDFMSEDQARQFGDQQLPDSLRRLPAESLPSYRDRLYHSFRIPVGLAALNDVKAPFVEIANPLLSRPILELVRRMPDDFRTDKALFKKIVRASSPPIPFATMAADDDGGDYLREQEFRRWLQEELESGTAQRRITEFLRIALLTGLADVNALRPSRSFRSLLKRIIPGHLVQLVRAQMGPLRPSHGTLALRTALACRTIRMLERDGKVLVSESRQGARRQA
jgi:asparagine synthetase B (glutamine-hydrolysing)